MTQLTEEQIKQGWTLHDGGACPVDENKVLVEVIDYDRILHAGYAVSDQWQWEVERWGPSDEIRDFCVWAYRVFSPVLPSDGVTEAADWEETARVRQAIIDRRDKSLAEERSEITRLRSLLLKAGEALGVFGSPYDEVVVEAHNALQFGGYIPTDDRDSTEGVISFKIGDLRAASSLHTEIMESINGAA